MSFFTDDVIEENIINVSKFNVLYVSPRETLCLVGLSRTGMLHNDGFLGDIAARGLPIVDDVNQVAM